MYIKSVVSSFWCLWYTGICGGVCLVTSPDEFGVLLAWLPILTPCPLACSSKYDRSADWFNHWVGRVLGGMETFHGQRGLAFPSLYIPSTYWEKEAKRTAKFSRTYSITLGIKQNSWNPLSWRHGWWLITLVPPEWPRVGIDNPECWKQRSFCRRVLHKGYFHHRMIVVPCIVNMDTYILPLFVCSMWLISTITTYNLSEILPHMYALQLRSS